MAASFPSSNNTFVPSHEASGGLTVGFSRNPKKFALNQYIKIVPVNKSVGYFLRITAEEAARIINADLADFVWHDGQEAPMGNDNLESFEYFKFSTKRYVFPYNIGNKAVEQADWKVFEVHGGFAAQKAMTARTMSAWSTSGGLADTSVWSGSTDTATNLGGGKLDVSGASDKFILKTWNQVSENILKATLSVVQQAELVAVMNPNTARQLSETEEIRDFLKQSPFALAQVRGDVESQNGKWGLPDTLYSIKLVIEDATRVTSKKGATRVVSYVCPNSTIVFMSRPGGLVGMEGIPEFSTAQFFMYEEMSVETKDDPDNRRKMGRVVSDYDFQVAAPAAGYLVTAATD